MRAWLGMPLLALSVGLFMVGGPVAVAAPPQVIENTVDEVSCVFEAADGSLVFFFASASGNGAGSGMFVEDAHGVVVLDGEGGSVTFAADFAATVALTDLTTGQPAGNGTVHGTLRRSDQPVTERVRERSGNSWTRGTVTTWEYDLVVDMVSVPGREVVPEPGDCSGSRTAFDVRTTNPAASVYRTLSFGSDICALVGFPNAEVRLSGQLRTPYVEVVVDDGVTPLKAAGELRRAGAAYSATLPLISLLTGDPVADLTVTLHLDRSGRERSMSRDGGVHEKVTWVHYVATITAAASDGRAGSTVCPVVNVTEQLQIAPHSA